MRVLLDTCVLSELNRARCDAGVRHAIESLRPEDLFVSVLSVGEITKGIAILVEGRRKQALRNWLLTLEGEFADRLLPVDLETSHIWGEITATGQRAGRTIAASDGLIAATARRHGLHVMTRNTTHFEPTGVLLLNPWQENA